MHPVYILAFVTFVAVAAFAVWNLLSTRQHQKTGGNTTGVGGSADPLSGTTNEPIRSGEEIRQSLNAAARR